MYSNKLVRIEDQLALCACADLMKGILSGNFEIHELSRDKYEVLYECVHEGISYLIASFRDYPQIDETYGNKNMEAAYCHIKDYKFKLCPSVYEYGTKSYDKYADLFKRHCNSQSKLIISGCCFGGSVAQVVALKVLSEDYFSPDMVTCTTYGSPLFADSNLDLLISKYYSSNFLNYVLDCDIIPRLLTLPSKHVKAELKRYKSFLSSNSILNSIYAHDHMNKSAKHCCSNSMAIVENVRREICRVFYDLHFFNSNDDKNLNFHNFVPCGTYVFIELSVPTNNGSTDKGPEFRYLKYSDLDSKLSFLEKYSSSFSLRCSVDHDMKEGYLMSLQYGCTENRNKQILQTNDLRKTSFKGYLNILIIAMFPIVIVLVIVIYIYTLCKYKIIILEKSFWYFFLYL